MALYLYIPFATEPVYKMAKTWKKAAHDQQHKDYGIIRHGVAITRENPDELDEVAAGDTVYILCHGDPAGLRFVDRLPKDGGQEVALNPEMLAKRVYDDKLPNVAAKIKLYACEANTGEGMFNIAARFSTAMESRGKAHYKAQKLNFTIFAYSRSLVSPQGGADGVHKRAVEVNKDDDTYEVLGRSKAYRSQLYP